MWKVELAGTVKERASQRTGRVSANRFLAALHNVYFPLNFQWTFVIFVKGSMPRERVSASCKDSRSAEVNNLFSGKADNDELREAEHYLSYRRW